MHPNRLPAPLAILAALLFAPQMAAVDGTSIYLGSPFLEGWVPDRPATLRGVVVLDGWPMDGRWEEACAFWGFGILRINTDGYTEQLDESDPADAALLDSRLANARALAWGLRRLGERTGHPELSWVPMVTSGYSRFSGTAQRFVEQFPDRVLCFITGFGISSPEPPEKNQHSWLETPSHWLGCEWENIYSAGDKRTLLTEWRRAPGVLRMASMTWRVYHAPQNYSDLSIVFVDRCIRQRIPADWDPADGPTTLAPVREEDGWLGSHADWYIPVDDIPTTDNENAAIAPFAEFDGDRTRASWLLDEEVAWAWRAMNSRNPAVRLVAPGYSGVVIHESPSAIPPVLHSEAGVRAGESFRVAVLADQPDITSVTFFAGSREIGSTDSFTGGETVFSSTRGAVAAIETTIAESGCYALMARYTRTDGSGGWSRPVPLFVWP